MISSNVKMCQQVTPDGGGTYAVLEPAPVKPSVLTQCNRLWWIHSQTHQCCQSTPSSKTFKLNNNDSMIWPMITHAYYAYYAYYRNETIQTIPGHSPSQRATFGNWQDMLVDWNHSDLARPTCFECGDLELKPHRWYAKSSDLQKCDNCDDMDYEWVGYNMIQWYMQTSRISLQYW